MQNNTQTLTIQEFQALMQNKDQNNELVELLQKVTQIAKPEDLQMLTRRGGVVQMWYWAWG